MGDFLKSYNPNAVQHIELLYDAKNCHVDVVTSMKGLFDARHCCYSCDKAFSIVKHSIAAISRMLCRQPGCQNRTGFNNLPPMKITTTSSSQSSFEGKSLQFECDRCQLRLRTEKRFDCDVSFGICHLYTLCPSCNNTVAKRALSNLICSKKRCTLCAVYYPLADRKETPTNWPDKKASYENPSITTKRPLSTVEPFTMSKAKTLTMD